MNITYIGAAGMLGKDFLAAAARERVKAVGLDLPAIDITNIDNIRLSLPPCDLVINGAAYTRVDDAEREIEIARRINADGAGNVAAVCKERGTRLIHISTDYVFNGRKNADYLEEDATDPLSVYGITKWQGEVMVQHSGCAGMIVRTQSLYGIHGRNFVKAILNQLILGKKELNVVSDQISSPTYTRHLADALLNLAQTKHNGVVHVASRGFCSWHQFAKEIVHLVGRNDVLVKPMPSSELKYPAPRPAYSVLSTDRYTELTGTIMPTWKEGLKAYLQEEELVGKLINPVG